MKLTYFKFQFLIFLKMATGDIRETAKNIAINLEMVDPSNADRNCISGVELESMEASEHKSLFSNFLSGILHAFKFKLF